MCAQPAHDGLEPAEASPLDARIELLESTLDADLFRLDSVLRERALYRTRIERVQPGLCRGEESGYDGNRLMDQPRQPSGPTQQGIGRRVEHLLKQDPPLYARHHLKTRPQRPRVVVREQDARDRKAELREPRVNRGLQAHPHLPSSGTACGSLMGVVSSQIGRGRARSACHPGLRYDLAR